MAADGAAGTKGQTMTDTAMYVITKGKRRHVIRLSAAEVAMYRASRWTVELAA